jgi:hypothetical protein
MSQSPEQAAAQRELRAAAVRELRELRVQTPSIEVIQTAAERFFPLSEGSPLTPRRKPADEIVARLRRHADSENVRFGTVLDAVGSAISSVVGANGKLGKEWRETIRSDGNISSFLADVFGVEVKALEKSKADDVEGQGASPELVLEIPLDALADRHGQYRGLTARDIELATSVVYELGAGERTL